MDEYTAACDAETAAVKRGERNFLGVGLPYKNKPKIIKKSLKKFRFWTRFRWALSILYGMLWLQN